MAIVIFFVIFLVILVLHCFAHRNFERTDRELMRLGFVRGAGDLGLSFFILILL